MKSEFEIDFPLEDGIRQEPIIEKKKPENTDPPRVISSNFPIGCLVVHCTVTDIHWVVNGYNVETNLYHLVRYNPDIRDKETITAYWYELRRVKDKVL